MVEITITSHDIKSWEVTVSCDEAHITITHTPREDTVVVAHLFEGKTISIERINAVLSWVRYHMEIKLALIAGTVSEEIPF